MTTESKETIGSLQGKKTAKFNLPKSKISYLETMFEIWLLIFHMMLPFALQMDR